MSEKWGSMTAERMGLLRRVLVDVNAGICRGFDNPNKIIGDLLADLEVAKARVAELEAEQEKLLAYSHEKLLAYSRVRPAG